MIYQLTERFMGERTVYVEAESKSEALQKAREGDIWDADDPEHFGYRYVGPVVEWNEEAPR